MDRDLTSNDLYVVTKLNNFVRYELDSDNPSIVYTKDICDSTWMNVHDAISSAYSANYIKNQSKTKLFNIFCIDNDCTNNQNFKFQKFITVKLLNHTFQKFIHKGVWTSECTKSFRVHLISLTKEHFSAIKLMNYRYIGFSVHDDIFL